MIGHAPQHISGFRDKIYFWKNEKWKKKRTKKKKNPATSSRRKEVNLEVILKNFGLPIFEKVSNKVCFICYQVATFP